MYGLPARAGPSLREAAKRPSGRGNIWVEFLYICGKGKGANLSSGSWVPKIIYVGVVPRPNIGILNSLLTNLPERERRGEFWSEVAQFSVPTPATEYKSRTTPWTSQRTRQTGDFLWIAIAICTFWYFYNTTNNTHNPNPPKPIPIPYICPTHPPTPPPSPTTSTTPCDKNPSFSLQIQRTAVLDAVRPILVPNLLTRMGTRVNPGVDDISTCSCDLIIHSKTLTFASTRCEDVIIIIINMTTTRILDNHNYNISYCLESTQTDSMFLSYPDSNLEDGPFCRNPESMSPEPWCFLTSQNSPEGEDFGVCNIPVCASEYTFSK